MSGTLHFEFIRKYLRKLSSALEPYITTFFLFHYSSALSTECPEHGREHESLRRERCHKSASTNVRNGGEKTLHSQSESEFPLSYFQSDYSYYFLIDQLLTDNAKLHRISALPRRWLSWARRGIDLPSASP